VEKKRKNGGKNFVIFFVKIIEKIIGVKND